MNVPSADKAGKGKVVSDGTVAYSSSEGSANAVQLLEKDGDQAVRMLTVIDSPNAPTAYPYDVQVPDGGGIAVLPNGGAAVADASGVVVAIVDVPWAKDANGTPVATHFTTDGKTLVQHIEHNVPGVAYPVVADPFWFWVPAWAVRACGIGFLAGYYGNWFNTWDIWSSFGQGVLGCLFAMIGKKWG